MTWGLTKEHVYFTSLDSEDMMIRLRTIVDTKNKFRRGLAMIASKISKPYYGFVRETTFDFFNNPTQWVDSSIQVVGKINRTDSDATFKVTVTIVPANTLIPSIVALGSCVIPIAGLFAMAGWEFILVSLVFPLFGFAGIYVPFQINYYETRDKLERLLQLKDVE